MRKRQNERQRSQPQQQKDQTQLGSKKSKSTLLPAELKINTFARVVSVQAKLTVRNFCF